MTDYKAAYEGLRNAFVALHNEQANTQLARKHNIEEMQETHRLPDSDPDVQFVLGGIGVARIMLTAMQSTLMIETANHGEPLDPSQFTDPSL